MFQSSHKQQQHQASVKVLAQELKNLRREPVEGCRIEEDDTNLLKWSVGIFGPPSTIYAGGYYKATILFPKDYPYNPPKFRFDSKIWHPNIYEAGEVCISILHAPGADEQSGELACERWTCTQNVRTILLSIISLLSEPNVNSPANVDAAVQYRQWMKGQKDKTYQVSNPECLEYERIIREFRTKSRKAAEEEGIFVPTTESEYLMLTQSAQQSTSCQDNAPQFSMDDMFDYEFYDSSGSDQDDCEYSEELEESETKKSRPPAGSGQSTSAGDVAFM